MFRQMCVIYAFMRVTDDLGDAGGISFENRQTRLNNWRAQVTCVFEGRDLDHPVLKALQDVVQITHIPQELLQTVIDGVESDLIPRHIQTFPELEEYCYQVAGAVGLCCLKIWGYETEAAEPLAIDCGTAFQLTNILRDIREDTVRGRCYLPKEDLDRFGATVNGLSRGKMTSEFRVLMEFEVERTWSYYRRALPLLDIVSPPGRKILSGFFASYSSLLRQIQVHNYDVFSRRIRLSRWKKLSIAIHSTLGLSNRFTLPEAAPSAS